MMEIYSKKNLFDWLIKELNILILSISMMGQQRIQHLFGPRAWILSNTHKLERVECTL